MNNLNDLLKNPGQHQSRRDFLKKLGKGAIAISGGISAINFLAGCGSGGGGGGGTTTDNTTTTDNGNNTGTNGTSGGTGTTTTDTATTGTGCDNSYILTNLRNWKPDYSQEEIRNTMIDSNHSLKNSNTLFRYRTPIKIYTGGIGYFDEAVNNIEIYTKGLISFQRVTSLDELQQGKGGIAVIHGYSETCGHAIGEFSQTECGEKIGTAYAVRDNRDGCKEQTSDIYLAVTEHEIMHCLDLNNHFDGFQGAEGIRDNVMIYPNGTRDGSFGRAVLMNMYQNPPGTKAEDVKVLSY